MGDDRHGRSPRPEGRAPWERYPTADNTERDAAKSSRRSRHTDSTPESGNTPLTVQDLVQKVDNERTGRRRRAPEPAPAPRAPRRADPTPARPAASAPARPADATPSRQPGLPPTAKPPRQPSQPPAAKPPRQPAQPQAAKPQRPPESAARKPEQTAKRSTEAARPSETPPARRTAASPVADDIAGVNSRPKTSRRTAAAETPGGADRPEAVTDVIEPVSETKAKRRATAWPTTALAETKAGTPKSVGLSRLEASKQRRNKRLRVMGRATLSVFAVLALLITGGGWSYLRATANGFTQVSALDDNPDDVVDSGAQLGDENYLIVGTDTRAGANASMGAGTLEDAEGARADTVMLVNIPKNRQRVVAVSFPRDLDVTRPECQGWDNDKGVTTDESYPAAMGDKLNAVYALGGPKCLVNVVRKMTGLNIGHFIGIDFAGFEAMVDQVGGVEVCSTKPIVDGVLGTVLENAGPQRVSGETALNYVRARHVYGEERSDYDRINRQQRFMASLLRGAMSSKVLFDPGKLRGFIDAFTKHTWVDRVDASDLLTLGRSLQKVEAGAVTFLTIPTAGTTSYGNEIPRETDIKAIFNAIRSDEPLPGEKITTPTEAPSTAAPPVAPTLTAVDPSTISLLVSNGTMTSGIAGTAANKLGNQGFSIYGTGNYSGGSNETNSKVRYGPGYEAEAATVATTIPGATMEATDDLGGIVEVVIGSEFTGAVSSPTPVGDPITDVPASAPSSATPITLPSDLEHMNAADVACE